MSPSTLSEQEVPGDTPGGLRCEPQIRDEPEVRGHLSGDMYLRFSGPGRGHPGVSSV